MDLGFFCLNSTPWTLSSGASPDKLDYAVGKAIPEPVPWKPVGYFSPHSPHLLRAHRALCLLYSLRDPLTTARRKLQRDSYQQVMHQPGSDTHHLSHSSLASASGAASQNQKGAGNVSGKSDQKYLANGHWQLPCALCAALLATQREYFVSSISSPLQAFYVFVGPGSSVALLLYLFVFPSPPWHWVSQGQIIRNVWSVMHLSIGTTYSQSKPQSSWWFARPYLMWPPLLLWPHLPTSSPSSPWPLKLTSQALASGLLYLLFPVPRMCFPAICLAHGLTAFRSLLDCHFIREAFPQGSITSTPPLCPTLPLIFLHSNCHLLTETHTNVYYIVVY